MGQDSSVGIATCYGLEGSGIESRRGRDFPTRPDRPWGSPNLLHNGYWVSFPAVKRLWCGIEHPYQSSDDVKERVQLYFCSPSGLSWPLQGLTLTFWPLPTNSAPKPTIKYLQPTGQIAEILLKRLVALELIGKDDPVVRNFLQLCLDSKGVSGYFLILRTVCPVSACLRHQWQRYTTRHQRKIGDFSEIHVCMPFGYYV